MRTGRRWEERSQDEEGTGERKEGGFPAGEATDSAAEISIRGERL